MRSRPLLRLVVAAVLGGALCAVALALALPGEERTARAGDPLARAGAAAAAPDPARPASGAPIRELTGWGQTRWSAIGPVRVEARADDPLGGPPWVVRVFRAERENERRDGSLHRIGKPEWCAQLLREHGGRLGWVDAANRFRPTRGIVQRAAPMLCAPLRGDLGREPRFEAVTRVSDPGRGAPRPLQSVAWGFGGADATVELRVDGRPRSVARTPHGVVLAPLGRSTRHPDAQALFRYPRGAPLVVDEGFLGRGEGTPSRPRAGAPGAPRAGWTGLPHDRAGAVPTLEYRVADPGGGPPWGIAAAPDGDGGWCASDLGRIVGDRVSLFDFERPELGTFRDASPPAGRGCWKAANRPTRARPLSVGFGLGVGAAGIEPGTPAERRTRTIRRTLPGTSTVVGSAHPDVVSVTIETPRDVRTIAPSPRAHVFAVVYDGGFPTGEIRVSALMRDGSVHRMPPFGGF